MAKFSRKKLEALIDEVPLITMERIASEFDLSLPEACRILKFAWDQGLLLPVDRAYFAKPVKKGVPFQMGQGSAYREKNKVKVFDIVKSNPEMGVSVQDIAHELDITLPPVRASLKALEAEGELISRQAAYGGIFGKRPMIWGLSEEALDARDEVFKVKESQREKPGPKPGSKNKKKFTHKDADRIIDAAMTKKHVRIEDGQLKVDMPRDYE